MNKPLLAKHIEHFKKNQKAYPGRNESDIKEREERKHFFSSYTKEKMLEMDEDGLLSYLDKLWAMLIWGNKKYAVDKIIQDNSLEMVRDELSSLIWGKEKLPNRWNRFRKNIKGIGPAMMSEILCHVHPGECMIWNRRAYAGLSYLEIKNLPKYDYQLTGEKYLWLSQQALLIAEELDKAGLEEPDLLMLDYFIWDELQVDTPKPDDLEKEAEITKEEEEFIHNDVRDKLAEIGIWLGFKSRTETKVADGAVVDTVWESAIGNMGRVIYVFEVQTKGSIDSLLMNLLKALNNPAVQGVVAVTDDSQMEKIKRNAQHIDALNKKVKYWNYKEVLKVHESLEIVNESINGLELVPSGFY